MKKTLDPQKDLQKDEDAQLVATNKAVSLNGAANLLLSMLSESERDKFVDIASVTLNIPMWQYVLGILRQSYSIGLFTTPELDLDWSNNLPSKPIIFNQSRCEQCGELFTPKWQKQRFCSKQTGQEHECGADYQRGVIGTGDSQHVIGGANPLGLEPKGSVTSALRAADVD